MKTLRERFSEYVIPEPNSGCWLWLGATAKGGYGKLKLNKSRKVAAAPRVSMYLFRDFDLSDPRDICHVCDVPLCVNPDHLFVGTRSENLRDMIKKRRGRWDRYKAKEVVEKGPPL